MRYVPSLPPPTITGLGTGTAVNRLAEVRAARPVQPRTLAPLVTQPHREAHLPVAQTEGERRHDEHPSGERRVYCRRTRHEPVLVELRSGRERRHRMQRKGDPADHIDIEV